MGKIIDCITFFDNNYIFDFRYNVLNELVDKFVICESLYDHKNNLKNRNFDLIEKYKNNSKIKYLLLKEPFPKNNNEWQNQASQREFILNNLDFAKDDDFIFFSDPDEIPNPKILKNFNLKKKYGIFLQNFYNYYFNLFNPYETPWEGTRVCKKKNLKSFTFIRKKILKKNLDKPFWKFNIEKDIQIIKNGGGHFNNLYTVKKISKKLKTFQHTEFSNRSFSSIKMIKKKIKNLNDLFGRNHKYSKIKINNSYPDYIRKNKEIFKDYII